MDSNFGGDVPPPPPLVHLTRTERFSAAHRLHSSALTADENRKTFGKCQNVHGHNYTVEITVKGPCHPHTGMVMNITELKRIIHQQVMDVLDHKNLDEDVGYFRTGTVTSTAENISIFIWKQMEQELPPGVQMSRVRLHETDNNVVEFYGPNC